MFGNRKITDYFYVRNAGLKEAAEGCFSCTVHVITLLSKQCNYVNSVYQHTVHMNNAFSCTAVGFFFLLLLLLLLLLLFFKFNLI